MDWNFLCAFDDKKRLVLGAWTVMHKSVLRSLDNYHTVTHNLITYAHLEY